jgi:protoporphyrinogen/coproporphyrinogen III oxidase
MIGSLVKNSNEISIVGGGIAGLSLAYILMRQDWKVHIIDSSTQWGGLLGSDRMLGTDTDRAAGTLLVNESLEGFLSSLQVSYCQAISKSRFIYRKNKVNKFPLSYTELFELLLRSCFCPAYGDEHTLDVFARKFLGTKAHDYIVAPFITGVFACGANEVDLRNWGDKLTLPRYKTLAMKLLANSIKKKKSKKPVIAKIEGGMSTLIRNLVNTLQSCSNVTMELGNTAEQLPNSPNIALCVPSYSASNLCRQECTLTAEALERTSYSPLVSVSVFVNANYFNSIPKGLGVLFPACENQNVLGILFVSGAFTEDGFYHNNDMHVVEMRFLLGGTYKPEILDKSDDEIVDICITQLQSTFNYKSKSLLHQKVYRWPRAVPLYNTQLYQTNNVARANWCKDPGRILFSSYTGQVSVRGMIESVLRLEQELVHLSRSI